MKQQESRNLLALLQHAAAYDLTDSQRKQATRILKSLPSNSNLFTITNRLRVFTSLTIFALMVEQSIRG
ncbi:hypothetical protein FLL45_08010 [Aliikangiella marina]|uniref:Uncharacterized protein n=1 Tax=Aliikangiella marina TaxID=1712262 RepID=A0A545TCI7_9GAMM|nr:hypothetical protein [Aliikangiella marina]TQV74896.1 hypothetical protein FLL45_08010 [Aliikangiella marina]